MPPKSSQRIEDIRARVARRSAAEMAPAEEAVHTDAAALAAANAHFLGVAEHLAHNQIVERLPVGHIAPDLRPAMRQPRLLPAPDELLIQGEPVPAYRELTAELLALGQSLQAQQIQPIIVYPGSSNVYPSARYLILVGHRRWTAAMLSSIATLDAVVVAPPEPIDRVRIQYIENEAREEFSDMERAWALVQMKQALGEAPWEIVENQFSISRSRRHELTRMLAFSDAQQRQIALLRLQETQIRSLHSAVRAQELSSAQVDAVLFRLEQIAAERAAAQAATAAADPTGGAASRRIRVDGPTIARLVARAQRTGSPLTPVGATPAPRWIAPLRDQILRTNQAVQRAYKRVETPHAPDVEGLIADLEQLAESVGQLLSNLQGETGESPDHPRSLV